MPVPVDVLIHSPSTTRVVGGVPREAQAKNPANFLTGGVQLLRRFAVLAVTHGANRATVICGQAARQDLHDRARGCTSVHQRCGASTSRTAETCYTTSTLRCSSGVPGEYGGRTQCLPPCPKEGQTLRAIPLGRDDKPVDLHHVNRSCKRGNYLTDAH